MAAAPPPEGLVYRAGFLARESESRLIRTVETLEFREVRMRGVAALRTTAHFGWDYGYDSWRIEPAAPIPEDFLALREACAIVAGIEPERFAEMLVSRYPPGAGIGWHRDAPMFGPVVAGVSLLSDCVLRFRRRNGDGFDRYRQRVERRSLYLLTGESRARWQHSIDAAPDLRYSITFRTVKMQSR